jgi:hypothetical protein
MGAPRHRRATHGLSQSASRISSTFAMGRAGIEPATLGLRVEAAGLSVPGDSSRELFVEPIASGRMVGSGVVLLTFC